MYKLRSSIFVATLLLIFVVGSGVLSAQAPIEIEVWHRWGGEHERIFNELIEAFNATHPGIKVTGVGIPGEYVDLVERLFARLAARQAPPDVLATGHFLLSYTTRTFSALNLDFFAADEIAEIEARFANSALLDIGRVDGALYGIPFTISNQVLYYNPDIFRQAGLDPNKPPSTWEEVREYAVKIKQNTSAAPLYIATPDTWLMAALIESNGGRMMVDGKAAFNSPEAVEAMEMWRGFYADGLIPQISTEEAERVFQAGGMGMYAQSIMRLGPFSVTAPWLQVAPLPSFGDKPKRLPAGGSSLVILSRDRAKAQAAWEFLKFTTTPEAMAIWVKTGYLNPLKADVPLADPRQKPAMDQLDLAVPWVDWGGPLGLEIEKVVMDYRDKILYGVLGVKEGLDQAVREVNSLLIF